MKEYQEIIALLLTKAEFRNQFVSSKQGFIQANKIKSPAEELLLEIDIKWLEANALSLLYKRWGVVRNILDLDSSFKTLFFDYASNTPMSLSHLKHEEDAIRFITSLPKNKNQQLSKKQLHTLKLLKKKTGFKRLRKLF